MGYGLPELDPKAADPAKPSTVYQALVSGLDFPPRADGSQSTDFFDFIKEIRDNWTTVRDLPYFKRSPGSAADWKHCCFSRIDVMTPNMLQRSTGLAGQVKQIGTIRSLSLRAGGRRHIPGLPQSKDTGLVYAYNLVVLHEVIKALGYKGLAVIIDEAEHVRSYAFNRMSGRTTSLI